MTAISPLVSKLDSLLLVWRKGVIVLAIIGVIAGLGIIVGILLWWVMSILWPRQMSWRVTVSYSQAQTLWLFLGVIGWAMASRWLGAHYGPTAYLMVLGLALPVLIQASLSLIGWCKHPQGIS